MSDGVRRGRLRVLAELFLRLRALTPLRVVRDFAYHAFKEVVTPAGKVNFIGFVVAFLILFPLLIYTVLNEFIPAISLRIEAAELTIVPSHPSTTELVMLLLTLLVLPFLFGACIRMFEAVNGAGESPT